MLSIFSYSIKRRSQGYVCSLQIVEGMSYQKTLEGSYITLDYRNPDTTEEILKVNSATVQSIDVGTNNGKGRRRAAIR